MSSQVYIVVNGTCRIIVDSNYRSTCSKHDQVHCQLRQWKRTEIESTIDDGYIVIVTVHSVAGVLVIPVRVLCGITLTMTKKKEVADVRSLVPVEKQSNEGLL